MTKLRERLSYASVTATLALFLALGGGAAYAATKIHARDIAHGAVHTKAIYKRSVKSGKIAVGAVRGNQVADEALSSRNVKAGSIAPASLEVPLEYVANPSGGQSPIPSGEGIDYQLSGASWSQGPGQVNVVFGEGTATLAYDGSGSGSCQVFVQLLFNGRESGGGELSTSSEAPTQVSGSLGAAPEIDPLTARTDHLTAKLFSNGDCTPASRIDSSRFRVLDFG